MSNPREHLLGVRITTEWVDQYPVRLNRSGDDIWRGFPTDEFIELYGVPAQIGSAIDEWDREFQGLYKPDDPADSGFDDEETAIRWWDRGMAVARRLAAALPGVPVEVKTPEGHVVVDPEPPSDEGHADGPR